MLTTQTTTPSTLSKLKYQRSSIIGTMNSAAILNSDSESESDYSESTPENGFVYGKELWDTTDNASLLFLEDLLQR